MTRILCVLQISGSSCRVPTSLKFNLFNCASIFCHTIDMVITKTLFVLMSAWLVSGQRPSFAGSQPIGFPILTNKTDSDPLGNRFGDGENKLPLPIEAKGDKDLVDRISKMPVDQQPFWYLNWKALEEQRKNPQTYQPSPNSFANQPAPNSANFRSTGNSNSGLTSKFGTNENNDRSDSSRSYSEEQPQYLNNYRNYNRRY